MSAIVSQGRKESRMKAKIRLWLFRTSKVNLDKRKFEKHKKELFHILGQLKDEWNGLSSGRAGEKANTKINDQGKNGLEKESRI